MHVGSGGRYDGLTASFGRAEPAVGFVLDLDALTSVLLRGSADSVDTPTTRLNSRRISEKDASALFLDAIQMRARNERVLIDFE